MTTRRTFVAASGAAAFAQKPTRSRPNILFAIADDQSWLHTSAAGDPVVKTPSFDRVARLGAQFTNAISCSPGCAPSRAAILTGRGPWALEEAGTHASAFPNKFDVFPSLLARAGYHVGVTGKGAGPCNWKVGGWTHNPAGPGFDQRKAAPPWKGISNEDYAGNFEDFLSQRPSGQPFCFWYGGHEPHRAYKEGSGRESGKDLSRVRVPEFLPDTPEIRSDLLDYLTEVEHFDSHLGRMLDRLQKAGELDNTLIVVTSDNGMSFPRAKANLYEYGIHLPLAIAWPARMKGGRNVDDVVSFLDFAPTFLEAAGLKAGPAMAGRSLMTIVDSSRDGLVEPGRRPFAISCRERHSHARFDNLGYPGRALRTAQHLYIRNFAPDRWPAGDPELFADIDDGVSKRAVLNNRNRWFELACGKRPAEELFDIRRDPACLKNLAADPASKATLQSLRTSLEETLRKQGDPRLTGNGDIWESYPRYSPMRPQLGGFAEEGTYNPKYRSKG